MSKTTSQHAYLFWLAIVDLDRRVIIDTPELPGPADEIWRRIGRPPCIDNGKLISWGNVTRSEVEAVMEIWRDIHGECVYRSEAIGEVRNILSAYKSASTGMSIYGKRVRDGQ